MTLRTLALMTALGCALGLGQIAPSWARNEAAYSSAMPQTYKRAYALWRAQLPHRYRHAPWAARFAGDAMPIRSVTLLGRSMLFFETCKPRRCTLDEADAAVAPDGDAVFGVILHGGRPIRVGPSSDAQIACLRAFAESYAQSTC